MKHMQTDLYIYFYIIDTMVYKVGGSEMRAIIKRMTYEDKFDRKYCCYWKRGGRKIKRYNRKLFRRRIKASTNKEFTIHG
jgi:hypothetical protein